ncbi:non-ribosomal peptide synthetase [Streptomyces triticagri]|nr:non-ribosomal peptide synthetase [Streptomyces triticagri]
MKTTVTKLFAAQAEATPEYPAVIHPEADETLSYRTLSLQADRFAQAILEHGITPGAFVAVCLPPGINRIAAFLAVWRANSAYVSMDPTQPERRLRFIVEDSHASLVITTAELAGHFPEVPVMLLDEAQSDVQPGPDLKSPMREVPAQTTHPDDAAIIYYTSGTTGTPKGVVVPHASITHFLTHVREPSLTVGDRVAQLNSPAFDAITFEIWGTLTSGATLVVMPRELLTDGRLLGKAFRSHGVTAMITATSVFHEISAQDPTAFAPLRMLLVGGEPMDPQRAREVKVNLSGKLMNVYGPTETTTFTIWHEISEVPEGMRPIPIGRPLAGLRAQVLDDDLRPVRDGEIGELYVSGPCLTLGYLNRPDLTAASFVPDPEHPGEQLYRTGDRAYLENGDLIYAGRTDHQVKIRGFRIELGEIETQLLAHPEVAQACVIVRGEGPERSLAGFVVPAAAPSTGDASDSSLTTRLRDFLGTELPQWMVPHLVVLDRLPLTSVGKIDRTALAQLPLAPAAQARDADSSVDDTGLTPLEACLGQLWCELIGVENVTAEDDFFALGGHSILVGRLNAKIRSTLNVHPPLKAYYAHTTLSDQARMLLAHEPSPGQLHRTVVDLSNKGVLA